MSDFPQDPNNKRSLYIMAMGIAFEFGFVIAVPLISLGQLGKLLDAKHGTHYWVFIGIGLAIISSVTWFYKRIKIIAKNLHNIR